MWRARVTGGRELADPERVDDYVIAERAVVLVRVADDRRDPGSGVGGQADAGHPIADREIVYCRTGLGDDTRVFVPQHHWRVRIEGGERVAPVVRDLNEAARVLRHAQVTAADPAGDDVDADLMGCQRRRVGDLGDREFSLLETDGPHARTAPVSAGRP